MKYWKLVLSLVVVTLISITVWRGNQETLENRLAVVVLDHIEIDYDPVLFSTSTRFFVRWQYDAPKSAWQVTKTVNTTRCPFPRVGAVEDIVMVTHRSKYGYSPDYWTTQGAEVFCHPHVEP